MKIVPTPLGVPRHVVLLFLGDENLHSRPTHPSGRILGGHPSDPRPFGCGYRRAQDRLRRCTLCTPALGASERRER